MATEPHSLQAQQKQS